MVLHGIALGYGKVAQHLGAIIYWHREADRTILRHLFESIKDHIYKL
jgi:hypothetical protein